MREHRQRDDAIHALGEQQFFFVHMLQHILLGDLAPLCMVAGLTGPLLRPVLALPVVDQDGRVPTPDLGQAGTVYQRVAAAALSQP